MSESEKMEKAMLVLSKMAKGVDPLTGKVIKEDSFLNDPEIIRCFYFINEVLENVKNGTYARNHSLPHFIISPEQKGMISLREGKIGVTEFSKQVNLCINPAVSRKLTGVELNKKLKKLGVLGEENNPATGRTRTTINADSGRYGFELESRSFNGTEYEMVVMNNSGKQYVLDHLEEIMKIEVS